MGVAPSLRIGDLIAGKYRLERQIGAGGMGVVFAATHVDLDQQVALKFLLDDAAKNPEITTRFFREARAAVKVQSQHVARVTDVGRLESGTPFIVMEYLEGDDLENIVKDAGPLAIADAIRYLLQACEALAEAHALGIVHRDIKPANLFLALRPDGTRIVKLLDFGISKAAPAWADEKLQSLTQTAAVIGSPRYMSPEQLRSSRDVDSRADIWALGVTLYELLGGKSPFARGTMPEVCASILKDEPESLAGLRPEVPAELEAVIRRCLAKEPDSRYRNVAELALALRPFGPHGIIDISIERVVGTIQMSMMSLAKAPTANLDRTGLSAIQKQSTAPTTAMPDSRPPVVRTDEELERHYMSKLGTRKSIPKPVMGATQVTSLALDHRAGFVLSLVDGGSDIDDICDLSGMPRLETLRILCDLLARRAIAITASPGRAS
ncbi:MAG TPA: serine/threonine-protein kinase [Kofleriaceae bacterium]|nr:serine/threonine-protein kinase [Kofleriaceae bacterium]